MTKKIFLLVAALFTTHAFAAEKPNVIVILTDDLGANDLGCCGSKYHQTPNLDRLAKSGVRFTHATAACPVCSPTRAAIMTGKYPARLNLTDWLPGRPDRPDQQLLRPKLAQELPATEQTLPAILKAAGYRTAHIGKWHLGGKNAGPRERGFDVNIGGDQAGSPRSYFAPYGKDKSFMPGLEEAPAGEYLTDRLTAEAEKFIEANAKEPFFLYLAHFAPHIPMTAKADLIAKHKPGGPGQQGNPIYAAMLESIDDSVGRVLKKLDDLKLAQQTIIVFSSDNGGLSVVEGPNTPPTINAPLREGKGYLYEGGLRVPLIVRIPGVTQPGVNNVPVNSIDFFPTILDACGVKNQAKVDGVSLLPIFKGGTLNRKELYWHYPHYSNQGGKPGGAIRSGDFKLIEFYEDGRRELFDVVRDAGEGRNLILDKPDIASDLADKLATWRKEVGAQTMKPNPNYVPNPQGKDGNIELHSRSAKVSGVMLRYEPLPHKNTLGYWTRAEDTAAWEFTVSQPGKFTVEVLQGCGKGQGGSEVEVSVGEQKLSFTVEDTAGFQNFKPRQIGSLSIEKAGRYTLNVQPKSKAGVAIMDLRSIKLLMREP